MKSRILISLSLLLLAGGRVSAQWLPAEDFFNSGAQFYISNDIPAALKEVELGRKTYPDDKKLKDLEQLLKQEQQQQQQSQQNQQQQNQQQQKAEEEKQKQEAQKQDQQPKPAESQPAKKSEADKHAQPEGEPLKPGQMTPEEAKRLLDAQKDNEQLLQMKPQDKPNQASRPVKDW